MHRRLFLASSLLASTSIAPALGESGLEVIYVGGWDCPYCTLWKRDLKQSWLSSPEYKRVKYVEVDAPHLREAYEERYWKGDLKPILAQLPKKSGTPRFLIVKDGKVISNQFGSSGAWTKAYADLKTALAA